MYRYRYWQPFFYKAYLPTGSLYPRTLQWNSDESKSEGIEKCFRLVEVFVSLRFGSVTLDGRMAFITTCWGIEKDHCDENLCAEDVWYMYIKITVLFISDEWGISEKTAPFISLRLWQCTARPSHLNTAAAVFNCHYYYYIAH